MNRCCLLVIVLLLSACWQGPREDLVAYTSPELIKRGQELVQGFGACGHCHGIAPDPRSPLAGGEQFSDLYGPVTAANLTPSRSGIGSWNFSDFKTAIREKRRPDGTPLSSYFHYGMRWMADEDLLAVFGYLRSLQPVKNEVPRRSIDFWQRNTVGLLEDRPQLLGFVPPADRRDQLAYGRYLADTVADCGSCHNKKSGIFSSAEYLGGGLMIERNGVGRLAPGIGPSVREGLASWSKADVVRYLVSGQIPDKTKVDPKYCPINFYKFAAVEDIDALASYLKSAE